jgi:hypothetical protein
MPERFAPVSREPALRVRRIREKMQRNAEEVRTHYRKLRGIRRRATWVDDRSFEACARFVKHWTSVDILEKMVEASNHGRRAVNVLDDGCGKGIFLSELKVALLERHVWSVTTGLTLAPNKELKEKAGISIDHVHVGRAEKFAPTEKYDLAWSMLGAINYMPPALRREHTLKLAHSLSPKGLMVVGFDYSAVRRFDLERVNRGEHQLSVFTEMEGMVRALEKQGFVVKHRGELHTQWFPENLLVIRRAPKKSKTHS